MGPERQVGKESRLILKDVSIEKIGGNYRLFRERLADHYFRAWVEHGLCESPEDAVQKLDAYETAGVFESSFIALTPERQKVHSMLLTVNIKGGSLFDVLQKIPKYDLFKFPVPGKDKGKLTFNICFSVTAEKGYRVQNKDMPESSALSEFIIFGYEATAHSFKAAYSRFAGVGRKDLIKYYAKNVNNPWGLGPTGMHEGAYGGATLAIIEDSRPEDVSSGRANSFVLLPGDETQRKINAEIMKTRRESSFVPYEKIGPFILFKDAWPHLSLAR